MQIMAERLFNILLVEGDESEDRRTRDLLLQTTAANVERASGYGEAVEIVRSGLLEYDAILAHYRLGSRTGVELLREVTALGYRAPVILLTSDENPAVHLEAMQAGAADYLRAGEITAPLLERSIRYALERRRSEEALRLTEERHRALFEGLPVGLYRTASDGTLLYANEAVVRMMRYPNRETLSRAAVDRVYVDIADRWVWQALIGRDGFVHGFESRFRRWDGSIIWLRDSARAVHDDQGLLLWYEGTLEDVTARREAEEAMQASAEQYRLLFESNPHPMWVYDLDSLSFLAVNESAIAHYGYSREEFLRMSVHDIHPKEDLPRLATLSPRTAGGQTTEAGFRHLRKDGHVLDVELASRPLQFGGRAARLVLATDVTERKQAEDALRESEARMRLLVSQIPAVLWTTDRELVLTSASGSALSSMEAEVERARGVPLHQLVSPQDPEYPPLLAHRRAMTGETVRFQAEWKGRVFEAHVEPFTDSSGAVAGVIGLALDVSERAHTVRRLQESEDQLRQAQKMEAVGRLAGGVAHDFNNLLTAILGNAELMLMDLDPHDPAYEDLEEIRRAAHRAAALTQQLLAFSRKQVLQPEVLDPNMVVAETQNMLRRLIREDIELVTELAPGVGRIRADRGQVEQVILNLAVNARDAIPGGGRIILRTANRTFATEDADRPHFLVPGEYVLLEVEDTGTGMDRETQARVFEPFFTTKGPGKGTGLGLSTVYGIVKQSEGYILLYTEPGSGSVFRIYLPRERGAVQVTAARVRESSAGGAETILLVEDEDTVRKLASKILRRSGYAVLEASGGDEALRVLADHPQPIELILTDVVMPRMSGRDLVEYVRGLRPEIRVLYMSGYNDEAIFHQGVLDSGVHFLEKPFDPEGLARKVREILDTGAPTSPDGASASHGGGPRRGG